MTYQCTRKPVNDVENYLRNIVKQPEALSKLQKQARRAGADKLTLEEIDAEIKAFRQGR